jgi:hypothetical protein
MVFVWKLKEVSMSQCYALHDAIFWNRSKLNGSHCFFCSGLEIGLKPLDTHSKFVVLMLTFCTVLKEWTLLNPFMNGVPFSDGDLI